MTGKKKGLSIGAAMKQRMGEGQEAAPPERPTSEAGGQLSDRLLWKDGDVRITPPPGDPPPSDDPLESFNTRMPRSLQRRLKVYAATSGTKIQDVVQHALSDYLSQKESKKDF